MHTEEMKKNYINQILKENNASSFPYAKLVGTISGSFAAIILAAFWNLKLRMKKEKYASFQSTKKIEPNQLDFLLIIKIQPSPNTIHSPQQDN
ncbi:hypothetical protein COD67_18355 [Bacillus cereus]|nr:hypothetical protein COI89_15100 [Bacillus cereus]PGU64677.1 hypothetical protein COD67_18355 [Bacillus cereus]